MNYTLPDIFYELNIISVSLRLILALVIGGAIGLERGASKHPAGFRTHILVCVGAALVMVTNQFCYDNFYEEIRNGDVVRMGAQVITGVGFLGAGTIIVAGRERIKGLTTAAGLWASACIGLACGIGFYSGAIIGGLLIFISLTFLPKVELYFYNRSRAINFYVVVNQISLMREIKINLRDSGAKDLETTLISANYHTPSEFSFNLTGHVPKGINVSSLRESIENTDGVILVENY